MSYTLNWEPQGVYKHFSGYVSFQEYARSQEQVLASERSDEIHYVINDLLDVEGYSVTSDEAEYLAAFNRGSSFSNPSLRVAYVTTDARILLLMRFASKLSSFELKAFPSLAEARAWVSDRQR